MATTEGTNGKTGTLASEKSAVPVERQATKLASQSFMNSVLREMSSIDESVQLSPYQKKLAEHLFIHIDMSLKEFEAKREKDEKQITPFLWANVNMTKLAFSAMSRIELGLDAMIPGTIYPIPYWNGKLKKYDLDLRIGYVGVDYYKRTMALVPPKDVVYELVREKDEFIPMKKSFGRAVESYEFNIKTPFDRGEVVGGFGYLIYDDESKNKLVIVDKKEFDRAQKAGKSGGSFWKDWEDRMQQKTVVLRTLSHVKVDPAKVNKAYLMAERDVEDRQEAEAEIRSLENTGPIIDITAKKEEEGSSKPTGTEGKEPTEGQQEELKGELGRGPGF